MRPSPDSGAPSACAAIARASFFCGGPSELPAARCRAAALPHVVRPAAAAAALVLAVAGAAPVDAHEDLRVVRPVGRQRVQRAFGGGDEGLQPGEERRVGRRADDLGQQLLLAVGEDGVEGLAAEEVDLDLEVVRQLRQEGLQQQLRPPVRKAHPPQVLAELTAAAALRHRLDGAPRLGALAAPRRQQRAQPSPPSAPPAFAAAAAASAAALASSSAAVALNCGSEPLQKATLPPSAFDGFETSRKPFAPASQFGRASPSA